jgi:deoxycytidylate deaminase
MTPNSDLRKILKYLTFMKITERISMLSYDTKHQVGSIIVNSDFSNICAVGYNGNYPKGSNERDSMETGESGFLHAEENAIIQANLVHGEEYILFVTMTPCKMCAKRISLKHKGIKEVVALNVYGEDEVSKKILDNAGIDFIYMEDKFRALFMKTQMAQDLRNGLFYDYRKLDLNHMMKKHIGEFFEVNKKPLKNLPKIQVPLRIENENFDDITHRYIKTLFENLCKIL